jgi:hypothetical protein
LKRCVTRHNRIKSCWKSFLPPKLKKSNKPKEPDKPDKPKKLNKLNKPDQQPLLPREKDMMINA